MSHKPVGCFTSYEDYASQPEMDDYRTEKEQRDDMADYLNDRACDYQHELAERDCGAR